MKRLSLAVLLLMSGMALAADPKLVVWDGDEHAVGGGWGHGADKPNAVQSEGHSEKTSIRFVKDGPGWGGWGWNWHNWKPNAADDVTGYTTFSFWAKVSGDTKPTQMLVTWPPTAASTARPSMRSSISPSSWMESGSRSESP